MKKVYFMLLVAILTGCHPKSSCNNKTQSRMSNFILNKNMEAHILRYNSSSFHTKDSVYALSFFSNKNPDPIAPGFQRAMHSDTFIVISQFTMEEAKYKGYRGVIMNRGITLLVFDENNIGDKFYNKIKLQKKYLYEFHPINTENHCSFTMSVIHGQAVPNERW